MRKLFRLTQSGVDELKAEYDHAVARRTDVAEAIRSARELGDLSENSEYQSARADQERNEARISELNNILQNVDIIEKPKNGNKVQLGSKVTLKGPKANKEFQVVGTVEADPLEGKISDESPIGKALIGKKVGDSVEIKTPAETIVYELIAIN
ncbi:MAG: transcription elongation factor GreA [Patescibacteria group bacterium]|nr:transcription elongation factor GreA [Patescibacteria group bacterium]